MKTRINENQKVTLTVGQLKRLVRENKDNNQTILYKIQDRIEKVFLDEAKALGIDPEYALLAFDLNAFSRKDRDDYNDPNHDIFFRPAYEDAARYGFARHIDKALETNEYAYMLAYNRTYKNPYDEEILDWKTAREIIDKHFKKVVRGTYGNGHWVYIVFVDK